jgi:hypothetical protein
MHTKESFMMVGGKDKPSHAGNVVQTSGKANDTELPLRFHEVFRRDAEGQRQKDSSKSRFAQIKPVAHGIAAGALFAFGSFRTCTLERIATVGFDLLQRGHCEPAG